MTNKTRKWIRAGIETLIHGGTAALVAGFVSVSLYGWSRFWETVGIQFAANGGLRFFQWWGNNPLPPEESDVVDAQGRSLVEQPVISLNPLAKVQPVAKVETPPP